MSEPFEEPEVEEVEDMLARMREHMFASDVVAVATTEEMQHLLASQIGLVRTIADTLADYAHVLRVVPTPEMATGIADHLRQVAEGLYASLPVKPDEEEAA